MRGGEATGAGGAPSGFHAGTLFAGRYRMISLLGRGGMGDVWRADDLILQTPVALKLIDATTPRARESILEEVRLARMVTHSAVRRVFDVGEADGRAFCSMELIEGEDLGTLLRRAGRLPSERVREMGQQICSGLAAAHAQNVLHRDLKPANILIDETGSILITDFGIAVSADEAPVDPFAGTPAYKAPEQLAAGGRITERTDVYGVGLVLYELVVGREAFPDPMANRTQPPPKPSTLVPDVDRTLERAIMAALAVDPRHRPPNASAMAHLLSATPGAEQRRRFGGIAAGAAIAASVILLAVLFSRGPASLPPALTAEDTLVLADFQNATGEPVFDGTLKVALAVALEQSPFLKVFSDDRVRDTLRLMERLPEDPITRAVAREIARRERLKAMIAGSIGKLGNNYVLTLETINAESGDVMAREQIEVPTREAVLSSLGGAVARLREKLGESLTSVSRYDTPLPRATTGSLDALHAYSLALDEGRILPRAEAIPHLQRAIELDPEFALAHALLSGVYTNTGRFGEAPAHARRAFELRDRVSERERFFISWRYYLDAAQAWDRALDLAESWTETYPREAIAFNSLGLASGAFGRHARAVESLRKAIQIDSRLEPPYGNLVGSLIALNRFDEARAALGEARARGLQLVSLRRTGYMLAFLAGDAAAMASELEGARGTAAAASTATWEARTSAFGGRVATAHEHFQRSAQVSIAANLNDVAAQTTMEDAETHAMVGQCQTARSEVAAGLALGRDNFTLERAARTLARCGGDAEASALASELRRRYPDATLTARIQLPVIAAAQSLRRNDPGRALTLLEPVEAYDHAPAAEFWPAYLRGEAYLGLKDGRNAATQFKAIVDRRGEGVTSPLYPLAHLGLARAAALSGDTAQARQAYDTFLSLWRQADATLAPLTEGKREYEKLR